MGLGHRLAGGHGGVPGPGVVGVPAGVGLEAAVEVFAHRAQVVTLAGVFLGEVGAGLHHGRGQGEGVLLEAVVLQPEAVRALVHVVEVCHPVRVGQLGAGPEAVVQRGVGLEYAQGVVHHVALVVAGAGHGVLAAAQRERAAVGRFGAVAVHRVKGRVVGPEQAGGGVAVGVEVGLIVGHPVVGAQVSAVDFERQLVGHQHLGVAQAGFGIDRCR